MNVEHTWTRLRHLPDRAVASVPFDARCDLYPARAGIRRIDVMDIACPDASQKPQDLLRDVGPQRAGVNAREPFLLFVKPEA